jgi:magnesium-transporting ATPase (P-type)
VNEGCGSMIITAVGEHSSWGKVSSLIFEQIEDETPLSEKLEKFADFVGY